MAKEGSSYEVTFRLYGPLGIALSESCDVIRLTQDTQADGANINVGDRLTHVAGKPVSSLREADSELKAAGRPLVLKFLRMFRTDEDDDNEFAGELYSVTFKRDGPLGLHMGEFCRVVEVHKNSQAEDADCISTGDRLYSVDGIRIQTTLDVDVALRNTKRPLVLKFRRLPEEEREDARRRDAEREAKREAERAARRSEESRRSPKDGKGATTSSSKAAEPLDLLDMSESRPEANDDNFNPNAGSGQAATQSLPFNPNAGGSVPSNAPAGAMMGQQGMAAPCGMMGPGMCGGGMCPQQQMAGMQQQQMGFGGGFQSPYGMNGMNGMGPAMPPQMGGQGCYCGGGMMGGQQGMMGPGMCGGAGWGMQQQGMMPNQMMQPGQRPMQPCGVMPQGVSQPQQPVPSKSAALDFDPLASS
mmetsp:Transcript_13421/g.31545  ORF Transcript_13421/g.31545 Transcript_13421/m.31545 type:complete len:415 (+) Transcript_13421:84-1328(+)